MVSQIFGHHRLGADILKRRKLSYTSVASCVSGRTVLDTKHRLLVTVRHEFKFVINQACSSTGQLIHPRVTEKRAFVICLFWSRRISDHRKSLERSRCLVIRQNVVVVVISKPTVGALSLEFTVLLLQLKDLLLIEILSNIK
jgi:hypothetical protein